MKNSENVKKILSLAEKIQGKTREERSSYMLISL